MGVLQHTGGRRTTGGGRNRNGPPGNRNDARRGAGGNRFGPRTLRRAISSATLMKRPATRYAKSTPRSGFRAVLEGTSKICQRFAFVTGFGNHCHRRAARVLCASTIFWTVSVVTIVSVNIYWPIRSLRPIRSQKWPCRLAGSTLRRREPPVPRGACHDRSRRRDIMKDTENDGAAQRFGRPRAGNMQKQQTRGAARSLDGKLPGHPRMRPAPRALCAAIQNRGESNRQRRRGGTCNAKETARNDIWTLKCGPPCYIHKTGRTTKRPAPPPPPPPSSCPFAYLGSATR